MTLGEFFDTIITFVDQTLVQVVFTLAFLVFFWGVYQYFIAGAADEEKRKKGRMFVIYGVLGFVIMLSIWGIVNMIQGAFGLSGGNRPNLPLFGDGGGPSQQQQQQQQQGGGDGGGGAQSGGPGARQGDVRTGNVCLYNADCQSNICGEAAIDGNKRCEPITTEI